MHAPDREVWMGQLVPIRVTKNALHGPWETML